MGQSYKQSFDSPPLILPLARREAPIDSMRSPTDWSFIGREVVALPTGAEASAFDARAIDRLGVPGPVLMENAGRSAARILSDFVPGGRVTVVAGSGNNGGDGVVLARTLQAWGREVELVVAGDRTTPDPLLHGWSPTRILRVDPDTAESGVLPGLSPDRSPGTSGAWPSPDSSVVVDALLGTGIRGAPRAPQAHLIRWMNGMGLPILALDVPSGVDADSGAVEGEAVGARWTVAFGAPKRGTLLHPGRARAGRLLAVEIGFPPWEFGVEPHQSGGRLLTPGWARRHWIPRELVTHKNAAGRLLLMAGSPGMAGAAILSARGALRAGVGFLHLATPGALRDLVQGAVPGAVHVAMESEEELDEALMAADAVALGPGLGLTSEVARILTRILWRRSEASLTGEGPAPLLLDADALNLLARGALTVADLGLGGAGACLLTPHPGEARRLLDLDSDGVEGDPAPWAQRIAKRWQAAVLLKGNPSVVASSDPPEVVLYSATASSQLGTAGMGDVLTGVAGALLARGLSPMAAGGLALHLTGGAAMRARSGQVPILPEDVIRGLAGAIGEIGCDAPLEAAKPGSPGRATPRRYRTGSERIHRSPELLLDLPAPW
jgi:ADP-dependent NAD(P)H-hydrate dehydratase / NAD(P)H-hydrate epimerase